MVLCNRQFVQKQLPLVQTSESNNVADHRKFREDIKNIKVFWREEGLFDIRDNHYKVCELQIILLKFFLK